MALTGIHEVALAVPDMDAAVRLYADVLGLSRLPAGDRGGCYLRVGETLLGLHRCGVGRVPAEGQVWHLAFAADDALPEYEPGAEPRLLEAGANQGLPVALYREPVGAFPGAPDDGEVECIDHVVIASNDSAATAAHFRDVLGLEIKRAMTRPGTGAHLEFGKLSGVVLEFAGPPEPKPGAVAARYWGVVFTVGDLERALARLRDGGWTHSEPRAAVQPGALIATVRGDTGGLPLALIQYGAVEAG